MASVARRHGMNDNMIFTRRKQFRDEGVDLLPVMVSPEKLAPAIDTTNRAGVPEVAPLVWTDFAVAARVARGRLCSILAVSVAGGTATPQSRLFERRVWSETLPPAQVDSPAADFPVQSAPFLAIPLRIAGGLTHEEAV